MMRFIEVYDFEPPSPSGIREDLGCPPSESHQQSEVEVIRGFTQQSPEGWPPLSKHIVRHEPLRPEDSQRSCLWQLISHGSNPNPSGHCTNDQEEKPSESVCPESNIPWVKCLGLMIDISRWDLASKQQQKEKSLAAKVKV